MNEKGPNPPALLPLGKKLSILSEKVKSIDLEDLSPLAGLAQDFLDWTLEAKPYCGPWVQTLSGQASQLVKGLQAGRPPIQGLEKLLQGILDASANLQQPLMERTEDRKERDGAEVFFFEAQEGSPDPSAGPATARFHAIPPGDLEMFRDFLQESPELLGSAEKHLLQLDQKGPWDALEVYRPFHTLKGLFGFMGFTAMSETAHRAESVLEPYKKGQGRPTEVQKGILLGVLDLFRRQTQLIAQGLPTGRVELCPIPELFPLAAKTAPPMATDAGPISPSASPQAPGEDADQFLRVKVAKLDQLLETMEEFSVSRARVLERARALAGDPLLEEAVETLAGLSRALQDQVLSLRMVPVDPLFRRISRVVRDLSQKTGKTVQLRLEGSSTEMDKRLLDELWEPLVHLIRNAMDHGLEPSQERKAKGKNPFGSLHIKASQAGGDILMEVADDGRGLDLQRIMDKARKLGWLNEGEIPDPQWLQDLVFRPGFSTAAHLTEFSGRGVGLDVVRVRVQGLKGIIRVESKPGQGCRFILRVPSTLALMEGVLLRAGEGLYLLPLTQVGRFLGVGEKTEGPSESLGPSGQDFPPIDLARTFGDRQASMELPVGIEVGTRTLGATLLADEILGRRQVILRNLTGLLEGFPTLNGAALLGDGRVSLVLDVPSLLASSLGKGGGS